MHSGEINLHIYPSTFTHESRILRITRTLIAAGVFEKILVLARWANGLAETEAYLQTRTELWNTPNSI